MYDLLYNTIFVEYTPWFKKAANVNLRSMNADKLKTTFGLLLKKVRKEKGLSQEQLAHDSSLDRTYISMLERGINQPSLSTLFVLAEKLDMKASAFVIALEDTEELQE